MPNLVIRSTTPSGRNTTTTTTTTTTTPQPIAVGDVNTNKSNLTDGVTDDVELIPDVDLGGNRTIVNVTAEDTLAERYVHPR